MTQTLGSPSVAVPPTLARRRRSPLRWVGRLYWPLVLGLIALNVWWLWDSEPIPNLRLVERWLAVPKETGSQSTAWWDLRRDSHDVAGAISVLRRAVRRSPNDPEARLMLGRALGASGDIHGCIEQLRAVPKWSPLKLEALYGEGMALLELKRAREAEVAYLAYVAPDPNHPGLSRPERVTIENKLWDIYAFEDRWEDARKVAWQAYKDAEGSPDVQRTILEVIIRTRIERSHPGAAVANLRPILEADPQDWEARRALARALDAIKEYDEADRQIDQCLLERPKSARAWGDKLEMLDARNDFDQMIQVEKQLPPEADTDGRVWMIRGKLLRYVQDNVGANNAYQKALELMPNEYSVHYNIVNCLRMLGKTKDAEFHSKRHIALEAMTKEVPTAMNHYRDVTESASPQPGELKSAIERVAAACKGMGWKEEAEAWAKAAKRL